MLGIQRIGGLVAAAVLIVAACAGTDGTAAPADAAADSATTTVATDAGSDPGATTTTAATPAESAPTTTFATDCPAPGDTPAAWTSEVTAEAVTLQEPGPNQAGVQAVRYPRPDYDGKPWSHWGQGIALGDGRFLSAIGDHHGADGNSFIYEYDSATGTLTQIADVLSLVDHAPGDWGYGKIHAAMVPGPCGEVYVSTYWGSRRGLTFTESYQGDVLFRVDPAAETIQNIGVIYPEHGVASMAAWPEGGLLYAEAADPFGQKTGAFVVIDVTTNQVIFADDDPAHDGYRSIAVDDQGRAYISWNGTGLARYDPATNELTELDAALPAATLRWATPPVGDGTMFGVTRNPPVLFSFTPDGAIAELGDARGYTTSLGLHPNQDVFYYIPSAHGGAWQQGTPLIAVDPTTGVEEVVVELNPLIEEQLGLRTGGTYSVVVDPNGEQVYVVLNAGEPTARDAFGEVVLAIVTLP